MPCFASRKQYSATSYLHSHKSERHLVKFLYLNFLDVEDRNYSYKNKIQGNIAHLFF